MPTPLLFIACVAIWGTTWHAILYQLEAMPAGVGVALRFGLAAFMLAAWARWQGLSLRIAGPQRRWVALQGLCGFALAYWAVYEAERHVVTGLVAVGYAASPLLNLVLARWLLRHPWSWRVALGGLVGLLGVALIFAQAFGAPGEREAVLVGTLLTAAAVLLSSVSSLCVAHYHAQGLSGPVPLAWAMGLGALAMAVLAALGGERWTVHWSVAAVGSLLYLALAGSVLAFAAYYALMRRIGPARAASVGVSTPVVAMVVSALFEGYRPDATALTGALLAVLGNLWALWPRRLNR